MEFSESSLVFSFWTARPLGTEQSGALSASLSIRQSELMSLTCSNSAVRLNSKQASLLCSRHGCVGTQKFGQSLAHKHSSADTAEPTEYHICTRQCWAEYHIIGEALLVYLKKVASGSCLNLQQTTLHPFLCIEHRDQQLNQHNNLITWNCDYKLVWHCDMCDLTTKTKIRNAVQG